MSIQNGGVKSSDESFDFSGKVMLVGDSGVGKTCLLVRFKDGCFLGGNFISTVGIDYRGWISEVREYSSNDVLILLLGNKSDLASYRQVSHIEATQLSENYGLNYIEVSSKSGSNVDLAFIAIAREMCCRRRRLDSQKFDLARYLDENKSSGSSCSC